jgi:hypothetical protein
MSDQISACGLYLYLDRVILTVINKGNRLVLSLNAIDRYTRFAVPGARLQDGDMVDSFPVSVVHLERLPICREARREIQFVYFKPQP